MHVARPVLRCDGPSEAVLSRDQLRRQTQRRPRVQPMRRVPRPWPAVQRHSVLLWHSHLPEDHRVCKCLQPKGTQAVHLEDNSR